MTSYISTGSSVWYTWTSTTDNTSANVTAGQIWTNWVDSSSTAITSDATWTDWNNSGTATTHAYPIWQSWTAVGGGAGYAMAPETDEQRKTREAQQAEWRKQEEERQAKQKVANERAEALFKEIVGEEQHKLFKSRGFYEVVAPSGTRYRLRPGQLVDQMSENFGDKIAYRMCIHHSYSEGLPAMDTLIHQMLMIRCGQEDEFVKTANKHRVAA